MSGRKGTVLVPPRTSGSAQIFTAQFVLGEADGIYGVQPVFVGTNILNPVVIRENGKRPLRCVAAIAVAPLGADIIFDIKRAGVSLFNAPVHLADGASFAQSTDFIAGLTFAFGDILTFDMLQIGSIAPGGERGRGLTVYLDFS